MKHETLQPSPIVKHWDEIGDDMKIFLQNPYSWISNELKNSVSRRKLTEQFEMYGSLMKILDLLNSIYFPSENNSH